MSRLQLRIGRRAHVPGAARPSTANPLTNSLTAATSLVAAASLTAAAALLVASAAVTPASATMPRYDGLWSVSIVTKKGDCIASYRYPMRIVRGVLANGGDMAIRVSGKVTGSGAITVAVSRGDIRAVGSGRLAGNTGSGSWVGAACSGFWTAERRG